MNTIRIDPRRICRLITKHIRAGTCESFSLAVDPEEEVLVCIPNEEVDACDWPLALPLGDMYEPPERLVGAADSTIREWLLQDAVWADAIEHMETLLAIDEYRVTWAEPWRSFATSWRIQQLT